MSKPDPLLQRYREACQQDTRRPSPQVREAVLAHARMVMTPSNQTPQPRAAAANETRWKLSLLASVAVLGLTTLLVLQFDSSSVPGTVANQERQVASAPALKSSPTPLPIAAAPAAVAPAAAPAAAPELALQQQKLRSKPAAETAQAVQASGMPQPEPVVAARLARDKSDTGTVLSAPPPAPPSLFLPAPAPAPAPIAVAPVAASQANEAHSEIALRGAARAARTLDQANTTGPVTLSKAPAAKMQSDFAAPPRQATDAALFRKIELVQEQDQRLVSLRLDFSTGLLVRSEKQRRTDCTPAQDPVCWRESLARRTLTANQINQVAAALATIALADAAEPARSGAAHPGLQADKASGGVGYADAADPAVLQLQDLLNSLIGQ